MHADIFNLNKTIIVKFTRLTQIKVEIIQNESVNFFIATYASNKR